MRRGERRNGLVILFRMHRQIMGLEHDDERQVDHINGNGLDNRKSNLRICTPSENSCNRKRRVDNKSGYKGVYWDAKSERWRASIRKDGRRYHLGFFDSPQEAYEKYKSASFTHHGEFSNLGD